MQHRNRHQQTNSVMPNLQESNTIHTKSSWLHANKYFPWIIVFLIILSVALIRIRLLQIPLERDEGEYAYIGQLMLRGIPPYLHAYNMKLPGIYALYSMIIMVFGQSITAIHLGLLIFNAAAIVLMFLLARSLFGDIAGVVASSCYAFLSLSPTVYGTSAHATQFIVPFALGATLLLLRALKSESYLIALASGILYGLSFIIKQHAVFFIIFAISYVTIYGLIILKIKLKKLLFMASILLSASTIPYIVCCAWLYLLGVFPKFWFWTVTYARQYVSQTTLSEVPIIFFNKTYEVISPWYGYWLIAGLGLLFAFFNRSLRSNRLFLLLFSFFSLFTIIPGFYFRPHYFITFLPAIALLSGVAISGLVNFLVVKKKSTFVMLLPIPLIIMAIIIPVYHLRDFFFNASPFESSLMMYPYHPFPESIEIGEYIKNHTSKDDKIAIIGSEPQICFYSNRVSATGYIYVYSLMEHQNYAEGMQLEMIHEIETARPKYAVYVNNPVSWLSNEDSNMMIINWAQTYLKNYYRFVGIIDHHMNGYSAFWDNDLLKYKPSSNFNIFVLERITGPEHQ